jgi:dephospho-CoA kinase
VLKVAITGGAGSGKSSVCFEFEKLGAHIINLDMISREVVRPHTHCWQHIVDCFGNDILKSDNSIDRRRLRATMINDPDTRKTLEKIIHPEIIYQMQKRIKSLEKTAHEEIVVVEIPLLIECGFQYLFDVVVLVAALPYQQIERLMHRDRISLESAKALLAIQMSTQEKSKYSDFIIDNNGTLEDLSKKVLRIYKKLSKNPLDRKLSKNTLDRK